MQKCLTLLACGLYCLAMQVHADAPPKQIPLASFIAKDQFTRPRLSPDGKHLAVTVKIGNADRFVSTMAIYSIPDLKLLSTIRLPRFEIPLSYTWLTNTRLAVTKGVQYGSLEKPMGTGEILAVDFDGKRSAYLFGSDNYQYSARGAQYGDDYGYGDIVGTPASRNGDVFVGAYGWRSGHSMLYDINSVNAVRKLIADIPVPSLSFVAKNDGTGLYAFGINESVDRVVYRRDPQTDTWNKLSGAVVGRGLWPLDVSTDDRELFALFTAKGGPAVLVRDMVASGERTTLLSDPRGDISHIQWGPGEHRPFAASTSVDIPQVRYIDPADPASQLHKTLAAQFPGNVLTFINFSDDGNTLLFSVASDRDPGTYYLYNRKTNKAEMLLAGMPQIEPEDMAERRPFNFKARDGLQIHGYLTKPTNKDKKKLPMVVLIHGGPHGISDSWFFDEEAQFLANRGYAVLQVNYRGSAGRGDNFTVAGYREWGGKVMNDLIDGTKWAIGQGEVDPERICTYGGSFGGYAALMLPIRAPELYKCAIGYAGVYDLPLLFEEDNTKRNVTTKNIVINYIGEDAEELRRYSPAKLAAQLKVPVMLVHGETDKIAPIKHAETMRAALIAAGRPPEVWMQVPNEGHGFYDTKNITAFYERMEGFLKAHIGN